MPLHERCLSVWTSCHEVANCGVAFGTGRFAAPADRHVMGWDEAVRARVGRLPSPVGSRRHLMVSSLSFHIRCCMSSLLSLAVSIPATSSRYILLHFPFLVFFCVSVLPSSSTSENNCTKFLYLVVKGY